MLTDISIRQFRSCHNVELSNISDLLVLIGRNGAGKTNILKAIEWACKFACHGLETPSAQSRVSKGLEDGSVGMTFTVDNLSYRYEVSKITEFKLIEQSMPEWNTSIDERIYSCDGTTNKLIIHRTGESLKLIDPRTDEEIPLEVSRTVPCLLAINALFPEGSYFRRTASILLGFFSSVQYYPLHNFDENIEELLLSSRNYINWSSDKTSESNSINSVLYKIIDLSMNRRDKFAELVHLMGPKSLGLLEDIYVAEYPMVNGNPVHAGNSKENAFFYITFSQAGPKTNYRFSINDLSFGTKRILCLVVAMIYDKASVALLEQPEDGVHIGLVDKLVPLFRAYATHSQFIIASHSTTILNKVRPEEIYFISKKDGFTSARDLDQDERCIAETYMREEGSLSDFVRMVGDD